MNWWWERREQLTIGEAWKGHLWLQECLHSERVEDVRKNVYAATVLGMCTYNPPPLLFFPSPPPYPIPHHPLAHTIVQKFRKKELVLLQHLGCLDIPKCWLSNSYLKIEWIIYLWKCSSLIVHSETPQAMWWWPGESDWTRMLNEQCMLAVALVPLTLLRRYDAMELLGEIELRFLPCIKLL